MPGHARTPGRHQRLGGPLPRQLPNTTTARPTAPELWLKPDARSKHRWELPAVSRGYAQPWGWLPSPYSPLRHWSGIATKPVRLACLIHAANVHSEPGSNPSQMSRSPLSSSRFHGPLSPGSDPHPKGLRKKNWSQSLLLGSKTSCRFSSLSCPCEHATMRTIRKPSIPRETNAGPCEPSRRLMTWGPPRSGVTELTTRTPASLKGYSRDDSLLISSRIG